MSNVTFSFDLSKAAGLADLDKFLENRSYVVGFSASQTDVALFNALNKALNGAPDATKYPNLSRFYTHIDAVKGQKLAKGIAALSTGAAAPAAATKKAAADSDDDSDDDDLFGSDDEDAGSSKAAAVAKAKAAAAQKAADAKKKKKAAPVAKTQVVYEVKPLDTDTDLGVLEEKIRAISMEGLKWGLEFRREDVAFGIQKLVFQAVIEDDKVQLADIEEPIEAMEDMVQSIDLCTMNRL